MFKGLIKILSVSYKKTNTVTMIALKSKQIIYKISFLMFRMKLIIHYK